MGHDGLASSYTTPTGFRRLTGCQRDPRDRGVTTWHIHGAFYVRCWYSFPGDFAYKK